MTLMRCFSNRVEQWLLIEWLLIVRVQSARWRLMAVGTCWERQLSQHLPPCQHAAATAAAAVVVRPSRRPRGGVGVA